MEISQNAPIVFDTAGFFLSICLLAVVLSSSKMTLSRIRRGFSMLALGFGFMALSFAWSVLFNRFAIGQMPDMQMPFLILGMASMLFSTLRLFSVPQKTTLSQN